MRLRPWLAGVASLALSVPASIVRADDEEPGADPAPEEVPEGAEEDAGGAAAGADAAGGEAAEGSAKTFPNLNLVWTLPAPSKEEGAGQWVWGGDGNPNLQKQEHGRVASAGFVKDGDVLIEARLNVQPQRPGSDMSGFIDNQKNFEMLGQNFEGAPTPQTRRDIPVGNWRGGALVATGKGVQTEKPLQYRLYLVFLKGVIYEIHVSAHDNAQRTHDDALEGVMKGLRWVDTEEGVSGPLAATVGPYTEPRGEDQGTETKLVKGALRVKKPAIFAELSPGDPAWLFAAEARKPKVYAFVGVARYRLPKSQTDPKAPEMETVVDELESAWKNAVSDPVTRPKSEKTNRGPASFKGAKGYGYEFRGLGLYDVPFVEKGYVVKDSNAVWVIRTQFGGKDAEKALGSDVQALLRSFAFDK
jgi:hypothetical protein